MCAGENCSSSVHIFGSLLTAHSQELPCVCNMVNEGGLTACVCVAPCGYPLVGGRGHGSLYGKMLRCRTSSFKRGESHHHDPGVLCRESGAKCRGDFPR